MRLCFGGKDEGESQYFQWKYERFPGLGPENTIVVKKDDSLVGAMTLWPMKVKICPAHTLDILVAGGAATHPQFRGKGIWWKYMEGARLSCRKKGASLLFGYVTSATVTYRARVARGIRELFTQHYLVKILNYPNFFRAALKSQESKSMEKVGEKLGKTDETILLVPHDANPFSVRIKGGNIEILEEAAENPTVVIKGNISKLIYARSIFQVLKLLITRKIKLRISLKRIKSVYDAFKVLRSVM
jgi:GNAT superfamily N-acetyltransferase